MKCLICETEIKEGEVFYHTYKNENDKENDKEPIATNHSDCVIRALESVGRHQEAKEIQEEDLTEGII